MRDLINKIQEALKPSEYRAVVKGWNKERYADIFKDDAYEHDKNGYRVFIPITKASRNVQPTPPPPALVQALAQAGYEVQDYVAGLAYSPEKRQTIKIGKVLAKLKRDDLLQRFNNDSRREGTKNQYVVVISRHPYDIAGMSTDRGWTSCMNLKTGVNRRYVPLDVKHGSVVAYVTTADDKNLNNPTGRVLIKPFYNTYSSENQVLFGIEDRIYGTNVDGFLSIVIDWVNMANTKYHGLSGVAVVELHPELYVDSSRKRVMTGDGEGGMSNIVDYLKKNPNKISQMVDDLDFPSIDEVRVDEKVVVIEAWRSLSRFASEIGFDELEKFADIEESIRDGEFKTQYFDKEGILDSITPTVDDYEEVFRYLTERDLQKIANDLGIKGNVGDFKTIRDMAENMKRSKYDDIMRDAMVDASAVTTQPSEEDMKALKDVLFSSLYYGFNLSNVQFAEDDDGTIVAKMGMKYFIRGLAAASEPEDEDIYDDDIIFFQNAKSSGGWFTDFDTYNLRDYFSNEMGEDDQAIWDKMGPVLNGTFSTDSEFKFDEQLAANIFTKKMLYNESLQYILKLSNVLKG
jgi:hypothetical protein